MTLTPPVLWVGGSDYRGEARTPAEVRALAAGLLEAVELLERLTERPAADLDGHEPRSR